MRVLPRLIRPFEDSGLGVSCGQRHLFGKPEFATTLKCNVHPWMSAYLHVMPHPFFAVTQNEGTVEITGVPAGDHKVKVWHEFDKFTPDAETKDVKVEASKTAELKFTYKPPTKKRKKE